MGAIRRLFVAIPAPREVRTALSSIRGDLPGARWARPDAMHLTLRFLGDTPEGRVPEIVRSLRMIRFQPARIEIEGAGLFPGRRNPRVLVARVREDPSLTTLQKAVDRAVREAGCEPADRPFRPHITLARFRKAEPQEVHRFVRSLNLNAAFAADTYTLFASDLSPDGARHHVLASFPSGRGSHL